MDIKQTKYKGRCFICLLISHPCLYLKYNIDTISHSPISNGIGGDLVFYKISYNMVEG